jgi:hypothetical protein
MVYPRRFCGNKGLEIQNIEKHAFNKLGFYKIPFHPHQRFPWKYDGSFVHRIEFSGEIEIREIFQKLGSEKSEGIEIFNRIGGEREVLKGIEKVCESCEDGEPAGKGVPPEKHIKRYPGIITLQVIPLHHCEFI